MIVAGLDIGTSSCKFTVSEGKRILAHSMAEYKARRVGGSHTLDANLVWLGVCKAIREAVGKDPSARELTAIAISSFGEAAVPLDKNGNVLGPSLLFWDKSGADEVRYLCAKLGNENISNQVGVRPHHMFTINKLMWLTRNTDYASEAKYFPLFEDFIIYRMTGEKMISYSLAGRTMAFDYNKRQWSEQILDAANIHVGMLSKPVSSGTVVGTLLPAIARELGLSEKVRIITGGHDQMCAALGVGAVEPGIGGNGCGTVEAFSITLPDDCNFDMLCQSAYSRSLHADPADTFTYSFGSTGSMVINWYVEAFGLQTSAGKFDDLEEGAPAKPTKLIVLPYFAGTGTPWMDFDAQGLLSGINLDTTRYDLYRALLEGLTYDLASNIQTLERCGIPVSKLHVSGGGARSHLWMQIKADITGYPVSRMENPQAGTLGCIILALKAMGQYRSVRDAVDDLVTVKDTFYPDPQHRAFYVRQLKKFDQLYQAEKALRGSAPFPSLEWNKQL